MRVFIGVVCLNVYCVSMDSIRQQKKWEIKIVNLKCILCVCTNTHRDNSVWWFRFFFWFTLHVQTEFNHYFWTVLSCACVCNRLYLFSLQLYMCRKAMVVEINSDTFTFCDFKMLSKPINFFFIFFNIPKILKCINQVIPFNYNMMKKLKTKYKMEWNV